MFSRAIGGEINQDGDYLVFEGNRYDRRGFLYKNFVMVAIVSVDSDCSLILGKVIRALVIPICNVYVVLVWSSTES